MSEKGEVDVEAYAISLTAEGAEVDQPSTGLKVTVHSRKGFTPEETARHTEAMLLLRLAVNSQRFYDKILDEKVRINIAKKFAGKSMTRADLYKEIMTGKELKSAEPDQEMDLYVTMYYEKSNVVGYTEPGKSLTMYLNRYKFTRMSLAEIAANAFHEWIHLLGHDHVKSRWRFLNKIDENDTAYACGNIIKEVIEAGNFSPYNGGSIVAHPAPLADEED